MKVRKWGRRVMRNTLEVLIYAWQEVGTEISVEHPLTASSWRSIPELFDVWQQLYETISYGCGWGMRSDVTGELVRKGWRI
eukprot:3898575-Pyramimonas_sp.AAC.1